MPNSIRGGAEGHPGEALWSFDLGGGVIPWVGLAPPDVKILRSARSIRSRSGAGHVPTWAYSTTVRGHVRLESGLEHDLLRDLDRDPDVTWLVPQPARLRARADRSKNPGQVPDLLSLTTEGAVTLWAVRPAAKQDEAFWGQVREAEGACAEFGWSHRVFSGMSVTRRSNLMWLDGYRRLMPWYEESLRTLISEAGDDFTLGKVVEVDAGGGHMVSAVWHAVRQGVVECDLDEPFSATTRLRPSAKADAS
ncbi:TnsA-like heteromeric transposase endonuclease subunit [Janibacter limosus]|uniref:TnsA-like heteromeric transposase endonuclease subunit n=1 Tax=Janibacter limosus TaxID=53458 RepID=UPI0009FDCECA|nr:TnsA-like heteromeric transposase endonuclease subunit [Janibacter limosus]